ncbi:MAG TPA: hypothetical protein EYF98_15100 [Planctomycetes bacterium]|nr:hypothetical protein [Planctomycetota bacterium]
MSNPLLDLLVWVLGVLLGSTPDRCLFEHKSGYEVCVGGGNPVPVGTEDEYIPVMGTDVSVTIRKSF